MHVYLKIKIKSLAAEAGFIRREERKLGRHRCFTRGRQGEEEKLAAMDAVQGGLHAHRVGPVRTEARATQLAYAFLRGKPYAKVEVQGSAPVPLGQVVTMAAKYGPVDKAVARVQVMAWAGIPEPRA